MLFKPFFKDKDEHWFYLRRPKQPDKDCQDYQYNQGEFSDGTEMNFKKHCNRLSYLSHFYCNENGQREQKVKAQEPYWYR